MNFKLGNESYFPSRSDSNAVPPEMSLSVPGLGLNKREEKKKAMNKSSSEMYSTGPPCVGASPPYLHPPGEPRGPGKACLSSQLGKIVRETFLPRVALSTEDPLPLRAWHYERSGLGCNPSFRVESRSPFGLLRLRGQQRELLTKC
ncbi:hypothetical protein TNCT_676261 [Trichonephila clavata]|uniref:Uncharacterized protein n=1 Tax=Trichonephila clavata TaxID=2740835 RepID=A0A8X6L1F9_TRICU|nr:hypothetical protein TNCT_676261 [Trichonephila clavata]